MGLIRTLMLQAILRLTYKRFVERKALKVVESDSQPCVVLYAFFALESDHLWDYGQGF